MKKVLVISYNWPPSGGIGVQRWLKFSKYLPEYGWEPVILTVDPEYATYPATDFSLLGDIPPVEVHKTRAVDWFRLLSKDKSKIPSAGFAMNTGNSFKDKVSRFIRGNFFIPDPRRGWNGYAFRKACEIIESEKIDRIITTSPPHSTQLIGYRLRKKYPGIRWIADLRDPWTDIYYYKKFYPTPLSRMIDSSWEKRVLQKADIITTVGGSLKTLLGSKAEGIEEKIHVVSNGYDPDDFRGMSAVFPEIFTISYIGSLSAIQPVDGFLDALRIVSGKGIQYNLCFTGPVPPDIRNTLSRCAGEANISFTPFSSHPTALKNMLEASALLLIIPDHGSSRSIITGKIFEYLAAGKPVICLGPPDGDAAGILNETGHGKTFDYNDTAGIAGYIEKLALNRNPSHMPPPESYSRNNIAKRVAELLEK
ncbi:MAG TPA: glycosyltransferase family 4 protein [Bacteroidales bacterium]|jgi:glycosyltransferase involved in cell wall biosynthesis|nr:glycosyltransferase [Bacteroidales bacterium]NLK54098.1 glycosyltransferase family 4 protein [Bacteroidales bacterium]HNY52218.1 glycosyltransferase family 4 protein [Bacteroidales bacterium]HOG57025.1 glycosyltransferase family 4 protein [Bacteroidales bacterium]HPV16436.1 glycosyltransferase family 4 protein [Bacteroidales bacterium]